MTDNCQSSILTKMRQAMAQYLIFVNQTYNSIQRGKEKPAELEATFSPKVPRGPRFFIVTRDHASLQEVANNLRLII